MSFRWGLFVPTYRRKEPLILKMLDKDPNLIIRLCVRQEEFMSGFYNDIMKKYSRVHIINLGSGLTELGETRKRILDYCKENNYDYCCMFDDGIFDVNDEEHPENKISEVLQHCCELMKTDPLSEFVIGMTFTKRKFIDPVTGELKTKRNRHLTNENYFLVHAGQAIIIDVNQAKKYGIDYKNMNECGFEDAAFEGDAIKAGLIFCSRKHITIDGVVPNAAKAGGSHHDNFVLETKYDRCNIRCMKYLNMLGLSLRKKYVDYCNSYLSLIEWPFDYYRDVLVYHREENRQIIESHFAIPEVDE